MALSRGASSRRFPWCYRGAVGAAPAHPYTVSGICDAAHLIPFDCPGNTRHHPTQRVSTRLATHAGSLAEYNSRIKAAE